jgi:hypothetical protein
LPKENEPKKRAADHLAFGCPALLEKIRRLGMSLCSAESFSAFYSSARLRDMALEKQKILILPSLLLQPVRFFGPFPRIH